MLVTRTDATYTYLAYGPLGDDPDLTLGRVHADVTRDTIRDGAGFERDALQFANGDYTYIPYTAFQRATDGTARTIQGVSVLQAGQGTPVFNRTCIPEKSYNTLPD